MRIFKFGGASLKNAERIQNLANILQGEGTQGLVLCVSALGKTTNKIEEIIAAFLHNEDYKVLFGDLEKQFQDIVKELFVESAAINEEICKFFDDLQSALEQNKSQEYNFLYDQTVSFGELLTSYIISEYLNEIGLKNNLLDARNFVQTDTTYRDATVDWKTTQQNIQQLANSNNFYITQGFIAKSDDGTTTTLGREGSDYTAAIFAYCLDAEELTIWKDVKGVLNADPRYFEDTILLKKLSFNEAIELAYYGASVIHPKTIQPLHSKSIPLKVRSFLNPSETGTCISAQQRLVPNVPCYILKKNQEFLQISSKDFSFIVENDVSAIFKVLSDTQMKVNLLNNTAISLSLCIDDRLGDISKCVDLLREKYEVKHRKSVTLYTVRNYWEQDFLQRFGTINPILKQTKNNVVHIITASDED